ncbi:uncharacterized protein TNCV_873901 [Trichonephila clavipes]|nr:uncharacterized protein TNCV_873901 [Trichonephila clavipes]
MVELLCNHIEENISSLFVCFGCLEGYENQLGHECMTYSNGQRISEYGDLAILNMDWDKLVADFVNRNIQMHHFLSCMPTVISLNPQIVGHTQAPTPENYSKVEGKDGEVVNASHYTRPHYVPVIRQQFQTIEMILRLHSGDLVPFERGRNTYMGL